MNNRKEKNKNNHMANEKHLKYVPNMKVVTYHSTINSKNLNENKCFYFSEISFSKKSKREQLIEVWRQGKDRGSLCLVRIG